MQENLLKMEKIIEEKDRMLLRMEYWVAFPTIVMAIALIIVIPYAEIPHWLIIILLIVSMAMILAVAFVAVRIEQMAGYYECKLCHHRYVPTYRQVCFAVHSGRTRYMKCPECGKRSWQKKVITKGDFSNEPTV